MTRDLLLGLFRKIAGFDPTVEGERSGGSKAGNGELSGMPMRVGSVVDHARREVGEGASARGRQISGVVKQDSLIQQQFCSMKVKSMEEGTYVTAGGRRRIDSNQLCWMYGLRMEILE